MRNHSPVSPACFPRSFIGLFLLCLHFLPALLLGERDVMSSEKRDVTLTQEVREKLDRIKRGIEKFEDGVEQLNKGSDNSGFKPQPTQTQDREGISLPMVNLFGASEGTGEEVPEELLPPNLGLNPYLSKFDGEQSPVVEEAKGQVSFYSEKLGTFMPVERGFKIDKPILMLTSSNSFAVVSFAGKIAARLSENTRIVVSPLQNGRYEVDLRVGTISALLDPNRDRKRDPVFAVRTHSGVTEATGTFYAVTEYKGQTYSAVKKGRVIKKTVPPTKPDFSAYLKQYKPKPKPSAKN